MGVIFIDYYQNIAEETKQDTLSLFTSSLSAGHEFIALLNERGIFYYMCEEGVDLDLFQENTGLCLIERSDTYTGYITGRGLYHSKPIFGLLANAITERGLPSMEKALTSFIEYDRDRKWYSLDSDLNHFVNGNRHCYYIHDFYPKAYPENRRRFQGMINNTVYSFKSGEAARVVAKLLALGISKRNEIIKDRDNTILLCIPASTSEKHEKRFRNFSAMLSLYLDIENGYDLIYISKDRQYGDVRRGMPITDSIRLKDNGESMAGKHILLCDDIYTSGRSFAGMADHLEAHGSLSVTGIFLGKTIGT